MSEKKKIFKRIRNSAVIKNPLLFEAVGLCPVVAIALSLRLALFLALVTANAPAQTAIHQGAVTGSKSAAVAPITREEKSLDSSPPNIFSPSLRQIAAAATEQKTRSRTLIP